MSGLFVELNAFDFFFNLRVDWADWIGVLCDRYCSFERSTLGDMKMWGLSVALFQVFCLPIFSASFCLGCTDDTPLFAARVTPSPAYCCAHSFFSWFAPFHASECLTLVVWRERKRISMYQFRYTRCEIAKAFIVTTLRQEMVFVRNNCLFSRLRRGREP